jgi:hypothetical protein
MEEHPSVRFAQHPAKPGAVLGRITAATHANVETAGLSRTAAL